MNLARADMVNTMNFFIDESGCLGFKKGSSNFLVFAYIEVVKQGAIDRAIKRFQKRKKIKGKYASRELKFSNSRHELRINALKAFARRDWDAGIIILEKRKTQVQLRTLPNILYNFAILDRFMKKVLPDFNINNQINMCVDKRVYNMRQIAFDEYAFKKASYIWNVELKRSPQITPDHLCVTHKKSQYIPCLQLADYVAGATFQLYENNDSRYFEIIRNKIKHIDYLWP